METTQAKPANLMVALVAVALTMLTLTALAAWSLVAFGAFGHGGAPMMGNPGMMGGMMINTADGPRGGLMGNMMGGDMPKDCVKRMRSGAETKEMTDTCKKKMGGADHEKLHERMHGTSTKNTL